MTAREVLKILKKDGWEQIKPRTRGSHVQLKHPIKPGKVTVPMHVGDLPTGTVKNIFKQAGLK